MRAPLLANKIDGDCFALVRAHQHGITIHNQDVMRERESGGNIIYHILLWGGGGGGGGGRTMLGGGTIVLPLPFCIKPDKLIAVRQSKPKDRLPPSE